MDHHAREWRSARAPRARLRRRPAIPMGNPKILPCDQAAIRATPGVPACAARRTWVLVAAVLGSTLAFVDESVVNVALPKIEADLNASLAAMQWVVNAYTLCMSALLLIGGAAADQFGRRRVFLIGVTVFAVASLGSGLAPNVQWLIAARTLQGVGAALLVPCSLALIGAAYDEKERGAAIGIWSGASAIAAGVAPLLGGTLVDHASWRTIFLINPLLAVPTIWITLRHVPESRDSQASTALDWRGALLAFAGLATLVYALIAAAVRGWTDRLVLAGLAAGTIGLGAFLLAERRSRAPYSCRVSRLMPLKVRRRKSSSGIIGARLPLIIGPVLTAAGFVMLSATEAPYPILLLSMTVLGLGMAITVAPLTTAVLNAVPAHRTGVASGINNAVASVGGLVMIALLGTVALGCFDRALARHLQDAPASPAVTQVVESARGGFVIPAMPASLSSAEREQARAVVAASLEDTVTLVMWIAAALAVLSALTAAVTIAPPATLKAADTPPRPS